MLIIIDAYNILKQVIKNSFISENQRQEFINNLKNYANITKNNIILVFDGGYDYPTKSEKDRITIVYSGRKSTADQYIKNYINYLINNNSGNNILVVSSDRKINQKAFENKIISMDSLEFYKLIKDKITKNKLNLVKTKEPIRKFLDPDFNNNYSGELDLERLYQENKIILYKNEEEQNLQKNSAVNKISKEERKLLKILKKL